MVGLEDALRMEITAIRHGGTMSVSERRYKKRL